MANEKRIVMYRTRPDGQTYWFPVEGSHDDAVAEFDRLNTLTPQEAPWLNGIAKRGLHLVGIEQVA